MQPLYLFTIIASVLLSVNGARILSVFPFPLKGHYIVFEPLLKRLSEKGHEVVSVSHFPQKVPLSNFTDVNVVPSSSTEKPGTLSFSFIGGLSSWKYTLYLLQDGVETCDLLLQHPEVKKIMESNEKFDVMIVEIFSTDCFLSIAHVLDIPIVVGASSSVSGPHVNEILGNPEAPSYIPIWISAFTQQMSFLQRCVNGAMLLYTKFSYRCYSDRPSYRIAKTHLGDDLPDFDTLRSKISLILANGHPVINSRRPLAPGFKELGGIHIPTTGPSPLPEDLQKYLDAEDKNGVIYFSLGAIVDASTLPSQLFAAFSKVFEQVPQRILWKCSEQEMPKLPKNVKCIEWAPQLAILCHPNVRLFITHGGLLGTQEAIYCGVPILAMPLFGDQHMNTAHIVKKGLALQLDHSGLSHELISKALNEMLANKSYTEAAQKLSLQFRDRQVPPVDEGVYWIEYIIRHGPNSLKMTLNLKWYQYLMLDAVFAIIALLSLVFWMMYRLLKRIIYRRRTVSSDIEKKFN